MGYFFGPKLNETLISRILFEKCMKLWKKMTHDEMEKKSI